MLRQTNGDICALTKLLSPAKSEPCLKVLYLARGNNTHEKMLPMPLIDSNSRYPSLEYLDNSNYDSVNDSRSFGGQSSDVAFVNNVFTTEIIRAASTDQLLKIRQEPQKSVSEVDSLNRRLRYIFFILMAVCVLLFATLLYVFIGVGPSKEGHLKLDSGGSSEYPICFDISDIESFKDLWDHIAHNKAGKKMCFGDISWLPKLMMWTAVTTILYWIMLVGNVTSSSKQRSSQINNDKPFAHLMLNVSVTYKKLNECSPLQFIVSGVDGSHVRNMEKDMRNGGLKIQQNGYYFVYSNVVYKEWEYNTTRTPKHIVYKNYHDLSTDGKVILLESSMDNKGTNSFLQGIFLLKEGDAITVCAIGDRLYKDKAKFIYIGAYMI